MIDPPSLPLKPDFPNRLKFCAFGLAFGLALGAVVVGAFEFMDDRLHSEKEIKGLLPMKVLFEIPEVLTPWDELKRRNRMLLRWGLTVLVFAAILVGSAFSYLHN
jgi:polysaccharide biosynthesis transport protein